MVSKTAQAVSGLEPIRVVAVASPQPFITALEANRFLSAGMMLVLVHQQGHDVPPKCASLVMTDKCLMPYPETWSLEGAENKASPGGETIAN